MARDLYCYGCSTTTHQFQSEGDDQPVCPACGSDFVEFRAAAMPANNSAPPGFDGMANNPLDLITRMISSLAQQSGASVVLQRPGNMAPINLGTLGDFGFGNMEDIMAQIMTNHQPVDQPTSADVINNLPKRKVPASSEHKGDDEYAVGEHAHHGEPCPVCHTPFEAEEEVTQLPCKHSFHDGCIKPWLEMQNTCPMCRHELPTRDSGGASHAAAAETAAQGPAAEAEGPPVAAAAARGLDGQPAGPMQNFINQIFAGQQADGGTAPQQGVQNPATLLTDDYAQLGTDFNQLVPALEEALADDISSQDSQDEEDHSDSASASMHVLSGSESARTETDPPEIRIRLTTAAESATENHEHTTEIGLSDGERQNAASSSPLAEGRQNTRNPGDPFQIGFAGPSRAGSSGLARSSNTDQQAESGGRQGLGVLQPLGWLARGAMNIGGNILGRRNSGNQ